MATLFQRNLNRPGRDFVLIASTVGVTVASCVGVLLFLHIDHFEDLGIWLGVFIAGIALITSAYAIVLQARQGESASWSIAQSRLGELYDMAHKDTRLARFIVERPDLDAKKTIVYEELELTPQETVWFGSLFLAYEQIFVATLALSGESQRVWRLYLRNQLNKPSIRAAFVRDAFSTSDFHEEFDKFVRGVINPEFFDKSATSATLPSNPTIPLWIQAKRFQPEDASFWLDLYRDDLVKAQMYLAPTSSEEEIVVYLSSRVVYTVFINDQRAGGFTLSKEKDRMGTFGFVLHAKYRGKGYSAQIIGEIEKTAKENDMLTLRGDVYSDNYACIKTLEKAGFRRFIWFEKNLN